MPNVIYIASARGGAGATTCAYYLGCALSQNGERTLIADGDTDCADGLTVSGMNGLNVYTLADAEKGACRVKQAILQHGRQLNLFIVPTLGCTDGEFVSQSVKSSAAVRLRVVRRMCRKRVRQGNYRNRTLPFFHKSGG